MASAADGNSGGGGQSRPGHKGNESDLYKGSAEFLMNLCLLCTRKVLLYFHNFSLKKKTFLRQMSLSQRFCLRRRPERQS